MLKKLYFLLIAFFSLFLMTGCWDYVEINKIDIVVGVAIDKDLETNLYHLTAELVDIGGSGKESKLMPKRVEGTGRTMFEAIRNMIKVSGKRLYWSHAKVVVISQDVAKDGIYPIIEDKRINIPLITMLAAVNLGTIKLVIPEKPTMITMGALTNLASTAACPKTKAPTILKACPI